MEPNLIPPNLPAPKRNRPLAKAAVLSALALLIAGGIFAAREYEDRAEVRVRNPQNAPAPKSHVLKNDIYIEGKAAYVYDLKTGEVLFAKNENDILPLASLTKIMMGYTALQSYPATTTVTISKLDLAEDGDSGLYLNERWMLGDLLKFTLIESSNDGASAIAGIGPAGSEADSKDSFIARMNANAAALGYAGMRFENESGLDVDAQASGGYGSARQISLLLAAAIREYPNTFETTAEDSLRFVSESGLPHQAENTDKAMGLIPGIIASKTGYTDIAGGNLSVIFDADIGHPVIVTVLGSSEEGRFADVVALSDAVRAALSGR